MREKRTSSYSVLLATPAWFTAFEDCNYLALHGQCQRQIEKEGCREEGRSQVRREEGGQTMTAPTREDVLQKVGEAATESAARQYDDYSKTFVALDGKAQVAGTTGGVLLGVIVALANAGKLSVLLAQGGWILVALLLPIACALAAMVFSVLASRVALVSVPFDAPRQMKEFDDLRALKSDEVIGQEDLIGFHVLRHGQWKEALAAIAAAVLRKGNLVRNAQWAALAAAVLTIMVVAFAALDLSSNIASPRLNGPRDICRG